MKLYKYLISGGLALTLSLSSCESWLEVELSLIHISEPTRP